VAPKGYGAGQPVKLAPFQKLWLEEVLADGVTSAALLLPRGNGKSTLLASMALWALFDDDEHGAPQVPVVAVTVGQAVRNVFGVAVAMRQRCELLADRSVPFSGTGTSRLVTPFNGGEMFPIASDPDGLQGLDPSVAVCDELGFIPMESWDSLLLASGKRPRSLVVGIGTPGFTRENALWALEAKVREGDSPRGFSWTAYRAVDGCAIDDEAEWHRANPALRARFMNLDALRSAVDLSTEAHFRIFRLGQWQEGVESWLGEDGARVWGVLADPWALQPGEPTWAGVDVGLKRDSSAVVTCQRRPDGRMHVVARVWTPRPGLPMDVTHIAQHLRELHARYDLEQVAYDPRFFDLPAAGLAEEGLAMVEFPQTVPRMAPACAATFDLVKQGRLSHDGDDLFSAHVLAAQARFSESGFMLAKARSRDHIDAAVAMVMAVAASNVQESLPPMPRIYLFPDEVA
jgi:phage terminase large subunit-like protein